VAEDACNDLSLVDERYKRIEYGEMQLVLTIEDPEVYAVLTD
jgi:hypothetical protein